MKKKKDLDSILEGCLNNDRKSQQALFEMFSSKMLALCMRYAHCKEEAEDMMIEGFVSVFQSIQNFKNECSLETWIHSIMVNTAIGIYRKQKKFRMHEVLDDHEELCEYSDGDDIVTKLQAQQILVLLQQMPENLRVILNLHVIDGFTLAEIAEQLGLNSNTVRVTFMRARHWLMNEMQDTK